MGTAAKPVESSGVLDDRLLLLSPEDNVVVARANLRAGDKIVIDGLQVAVDRDAPMGFKIARSALKQGARVLKYGAPIGSATRDMEAGRVVHVHNMKSDYIPPYLHEENLFTA